MGLLLLSVLFTPAQAAPTVAELSPTVLHREVPPAPFKRRRRSGVSGLRAAQKGLVNLARWPAEPATPAKIDAARFAEAVTVLCRPISKKRGRQYADLMREASATFGVDPFLLASVVYRFSRCRRRDRGEFGVGLAKLHYRMHAAHIKDRTYRYWVLDAQGQWGAHALPMPKFRFHPARLTRAADNLYLAAALLAVAKAQCPHNDGAFDSVPHRHFVSHFIWGDRVQGAGAEDRVLRARRRMLEHYNRAEAKSVHAFEGLALFSPLAGVPRKITSVPGADRDEGARRHRGIDFDSSTGEPVYALADGTVTFAGVDMKRGKSQRVLAEVARKVGRKRMGAGGLMVYVQHPQSLKSVYMHLSDYVVTTGDTVRGGQLLGYVGRSGIKHSSAHLHFEVHRERRHDNPMKYVAPYVFSPMDTWWGRRAKLYEKGRRRLRRVRRWKQRELAKLKKAAKAKVGRAAGQFTPIKKK